MCSIFTGMTWIFIHNNKYPTRTWVIFHQCSDLKEQVLRVTESKGKFETMHKPLKRFPKEGQSSIKLFLHSVN